MDEIIELIKDRNYDPLQVATPIDGRIKAVKMNYEQLFTLLEAVAREQRESDSQVTTICTELIAENDLVTDTLKELL